MRKLGLASLCLLFVFGLAASAQPVVQGVTNTASFLRPALPNGGIAQGAMFAVFGLDLGPANLVQVEAFPLLTELAGTSVKITVNGVTVDGIMVFTVSTQLAVILPSNTPVGQGTVSVTFGGQTSTPFPIRVVANSFGIFAINKGGSGPGVVTDTDFVTDTLFHSAGAGQTWMIWGTGLGAVAGDEAGAPLPGDMANLDVKIYVGGVEAVVVYRGRSGCCAGIDQVFFIIPEGVAGCYVPVVLVVNGVPSNTVTISISEDGAVCSDDGLTRAELEAAQAAGELRAGSILVNRSDYRLTPPPPLPGIQVKSDTGSASFARYDISQLIASQSISGVSTLGSCVVYQYIGLRPVQLDPGPRSPLDAGNDITVNGPVGEGMLGAVGGGSYFGQLGGGQNQAIPGLPGNPLPDFLEPGSFTVDNGDGGTDADAFQGAFSLGTAPIWTNQSETTSVDRGNDYTVTWAAGAPEGAWAVISGNSTSITGNVGAGFLCRERVSELGLTIPDYVLGALPPSEVQEGVSTGYMFVGISEEQAILNAEGLDRLRMVITIGNAHSLEFR